LGLRPKVTDIMMLRPGRMLMESAPAMGAVMKVALKLRWVLV
jgi:hypothetical protein